jgi:hypothetical protein
MSFRSGLNDEFWVGTPMAGDPEGKRVMRPDWSAAIMMAMSTLPGA